MSCLWNVSMIFQNSTSVPCCWSCACPSLCHSEPVSGSLQLCALPLRSSCSVGHLAYGSGSLGCIPRGSGVHGTSSIE
ncbi:hypothetical protein EDC04DRAFT_2743845 [Pisolithus marmoratus]|nr:hypothetical protein EDC04DRAFT_2743845 [Pisolithus marmoratus]